MDELQKLLADVIAAACALESARKAYNASFSADSATRAAADAAHKKAKAAHDAADTRYYQATVRRAAARLSQPTP